MISQGTLYYWQTTLPESAQVDELSPFGTPVVPATSTGASGSSILGYSKDSWAVLSYAWASEAPGCISCFALNSSTGAVTLGSNGGALNFNSAKVCRRRRFFANALTPGVTNAQLCRRTTFPFASRTLPSACLTLRQW